MACHVYKGMEATASNDNCGGNYQVLAKCDVGVGYFEL